MLETVVAWTRDRPTPTSNRPTLTPSLDGRSMWVSNNAGLVEIDTQSLHEISRVTKADGLVDDEAWAYGPLATDSAGRFRRAGWIDVAAGPGARLEVPAEPAPTSGNIERRRQLRAGVDQARLGRCMRSIAKAGLTGTYVQIAIAVDAQGAVGFLNVVDTDLPSATASCVREVLADVRFGIGPPASWTERIDL